MIGGHTSQDGNNAVEVVCALICKEKTRNGRKNGWKNGAGYADSRDDWAELVGRKYVFCNEIVVQQGQHRYR